MSGDFAFVAFNVDGGDDFAIVLLKDVTNRTVYFTDHEADGMGPLDKNDNEGTLTWQTGMTTIPAGTIVIFTDASSAGAVSHGTVSEDDAGFNLSASGDAILAFEGSDNSTPTSYIAGIQNTRDVNSFGDLSGTGLDNCTAITISNNLTDDGAVYSGDRNTASSFGAYLDSIKNITNWTTSTSDGESLLPFDNSSFSIISTCTPPDITGRDTTICMGASLDLKLLLTGSFEGALRYGTTFGSYPDTITTLVYPAMTTTYYVQDSVDGTSCTDTAEITVNVMDCTIPCDIDIAFADTVCNADGTYDLKVTVDSTAALSDRLVAIIDGMAVDTLPYPIADGMQICIETGHLGDGDNGLQLIVADTMRGEKMLFIEDFETDGNGTRYTTSISEFKEADSDFFGRTDGSDIGTYTVSGQSGSFFFGIEDVDANDADDIDTLFMQNINISLVNDLIFKGLFAEEDATNGEEDWDANTTFKVQAQIDSGGFNTILQFSAAGATGSNTEPRLDTNFDGTGDGMALTPFFTEYTASISGSGSTLDLLIIMEKFNDGDEDISFDNLMVKGNTYLCSDTLIYNEPTCKLASISTLADPCDCCNPDNLDITGDGLADIFLETVVITSNPGETWMVSSSTGLLNMSGSSVTSLTFVESPSGTYTAQFYHAGGTGYTATISNGVTILNASNSCTACTSMPPIPDPIISDIALCFDGQSSTRITPFHDDPIVLGEDFESDGLGSRYFLDRDTFSTLADTSVSASSQGKHFLIRTDGSNIRSTSFMYDSVQGTYWFGASDLNIGSNTLPATATMTFATKSIKGLCNLNFSVFLAEDDVGDGSTSHWNNEDFVHFDYAIDGGSFQNLLHLESDGGADGSPAFVDSDFDGVGDGAEVTDTFQKFTAPISAVGDSITLRISMFLDAAEEDIAFDSIRIYGIPTTYNFYDGDPTSGGTLLAADVDSYDPLVTRANSPQTIWVEPLCGARCAGNVKSIIVGVHPESDSSIICFDEVNVSVNEDCSVTDLKITSLYAGGIEPIYFDVQLKDKNGNEVDKDSLHYYTGNHLIFEVRDTCTMNSCWGYLNVEDKLPPRSKSCPCDASIAENLSPSTAPDSCIYVCLDSIYFHDPLFYDNCLFGMTADTLGIYHKIDSTEIGCDTFQYKRTWYFKDTLDEKIKTFEICSQVYFRVPLSVDSILWPPQKLALACDSVGLEAPVHQIVSSYGKHFAGPYYINNVLDTILLINDSLDCHLPVSFEQQFVQTCVNESRLMRTWRVLDWCTQTYFDSIRLIDVKDKKAPDFGVFSINAEPLNENEILINGDTVEIDDIEVDIDLDKIFRLLEIRSPLDCSVDFEVPIFDNLSDNCSSFEDIKLEYSIDNELAYFDSEFPRVVRNVPPGGSKITITAYDECGNSNEHTLFLAVLDKADPVAQCNDTIVTTLVATDELLDGGISQIPVSAFDHTSFDQCGDIVLSLARRQDRKFSCGGRSLKFIGTDFIEFCCDDIDQYIPVELTLFDNGGNQSTCISHIFIENRNAAQLTCEDVIISCTDPILPEHIGYPHVSVPCAEKELTYKDEFHLDHLCYKGFIKRDWTLKDSHTSCSQIITITNDDDDNNLTSFEPRSIIWPLHHSGLSLKQQKVKSKHISIKENDLHGECREYNYAEYDALKKAPNPNYDIDKDVLENTFMSSSFNCEISHSGEPTWDDPECGLIGKTYEDRVFGLSECGVIQREWVVIDWCVYDVKMGDEHKEEIVFVLDRCNNESWYSTKPLDTQTDGYYTFVQELRIIDDTAPLITSSKEVEIGVEENGNECDMLASLSASASDHCGEKESYKTNLDWQVQLIEIENEAEIHNIIPDEKGNSWRELYPDSAGQVDFSFKGMAGQNYHVKWRVTDACNNASESLSKVHFIDDKPPILKCHSTVSLSPTSGESYVLWASDVAEALDCFDKNIEVFFKDIDGNSTSTLGLNADIQRSDFQTFVYAADDYYNESYCSVTIRLLESENAEENHSVGRISGTIVTENGHAVEGVKIDIASSVAHTDVLGQYEVLNLKIDQGLSVLPMKEHELLNGVNVLDLVLIQKHIINAIPFDSPYEMVAADVNNDGRISSIDLVVLSKAILGLSDHFENNTSWRFVDEAQKLNIYAHPSTVIQEFINFDMTEEENRGDFVGVKVGDVSGDVLANSLMTQSRNFASIEMSIPDVPMSMGDVYILPMTIEAVSKLSALQFELSLNDIEFLELQSDEIRIDESLINKTINQVSVLWYDHESPISHNNFLKLKVRSKKNISSRDAIKILNNALKPLAITADHETLELKLSFEDHPNQILNHSVIPNPFSDKTEIRFVTNQTSFVEFSVFDNTGKTIFHQNFYSDKGEQKIELRSDVLDTSGLYYYQIETSYELITGKIIYLK